jgi:hypothetical protein
MRTGENPMEVSPANKAKYEWGCFFSVFTAYYKCAKLDYYSGLMIKTLDWL